VRVMLVRDGRGIAREVHCGCVVGIGEIWFVGRKRGGYRSGESTWLGKGRAGEVVTDDVGEVWQGLRKEL